MACFECAVDYAKNRVQFSRPIAGYQLVQAKFADMLTEITKAQLVVVAPRASSRSRRRCARRRSRSPSATTSHMALETARKCRDILGGNGITYEYPIARHLLNLETVITYEGTHDIHTLVLGQSCHRGSPGCWWWAPSPPPWARSAP
jgi:glutaryl-CoA dehydrogenase